MGKEEILIYWLNEDNKIVSIIGPWDDFALENDGEDVISAQVLGKPIEDFIADDQTRMHINVLISSVRTLGKEVERDYRCDSPHEKRYMKMHICKDVDGKVKITNSVIKTEPKSHEIRVQPFKDSTTKKAIPRCSICNHIKIDDQWIEDSDAAAQNTINSKAPIMVIYTVCKNCSESRKAI